MSPLRVAVAGVGALGRHHARILAGMDGVELVAVADPDAAAAQRLAADHGTRAVPDVRDVLDEVDAVSVAVPTFLHPEVAGHCLRAGKDVLVEKPLASDVTEARVLAAAARRGGRVLAVGHVERFNPAFEAVAAHCESPRYIRTERFSPFAFRSTDIGAVHDLMIHDIELALALADDDVADVTAFGSPILTDREDCATARLTFAGGCTADLTVNRVHPAARRTISAFGANGAVTADLTTRAVMHYTATNELKVGPAPLAALGLPGADRNALRDSVFGRWIGVTEVKVSDADALTAELADFVDCCRTGAAARVDGPAAVRALEVAEWVVEEIATGGREVLRKAA